VELAQLGVVILTPGSAVASVLVTDGGAGGTPKLTLQAATNGSSVVALVNMHIVTDVYVNLTGTGASVTCLVGESNASFV